MCSLEQVLTQARQLASRMHSHDQSLETMIQKAGSVESRLQVMQQYQEATLALSEMAKHARPRSHLILNIAAENKQLSQLKTENRDLRTALDEHQAALELIMSKYREQMTKLMESGGSGNSPSSSEFGAADSGSSQLGFRAYPSPLISSDLAARQQLIIKRLSERVQDLSTKLRDSNNEGESVALEMETLIQQLITENEGLRSLLAISNGKRQPGGRMTVSAVGLSSAELGDFRLSPPVPESSVEEGGGRSSKFRPVLHKRYSGNLDIHPQGEGEEEEISYIDSDQGYDIEVPNVKGKEGEEDGEMDS